MAKYRKSFITWLIAGAFITVFACVFGAEQASANGYTVPMRLCDGFFVAAVMVLGCGGLRFVSSFGFFDIMGFGIKQVLNIHWMGLNVGGEEYRDESYADYKVRKSQNRASPTGVLLAGAVYAVLATIMLVIYLLTA